MGKNLSFYTEKNFIYALYCNVFSDYTENNTYFLNVLNIIETLTENELLILKERLINNTPFKEISKNTGITWECVHTICTKSLKKIRKMALENAYECVGGYTGDGLPNPLLLALSIEALGFSSYVNTCLINHSCNKVEDLLKTHPEELYRVRGLGITSIQEIKCRMCNLGFNLWATSYGTWVKIIAPEDTHKLKEKYAQTNLPHPFIPDLEIEEFGFSYQICVYLRKRHKCKLLEDLLKINPDELYESMGYTSVQEILNKMCEAGFVEWATSYDTWAVSRTYTESLYWAT